MLVLAMLICLLSSSHLLAWLISSRLLWLVDFFALSSFCFMLARYPFTLSPLCSHWLVVLHALVCALIGLMIFCAHAGLLSLRALALMFTLACYPFALSPSCSRWLVGLLSLCVSHPHVHASVLIFALILCSCWLVVPLRFSPSCSR